VLIVRAGPVTSDVRSVALIRSFNDIARLHAEYFSDHRPTSTVLGVVELALPAQLVEIAAVAVLD
jgi:enamine deaminase RidA (YjgF/YER057c/UK114 family)